MSEQSVADPAVKKPSRLRRWSVRLLKTLAVLAVIFALVHAEEYWRGNRAYARALADWKAAGLPSEEEFFKNAPPVSPEKNLLAAPFFSQWRLTSNEPSGKMDPRWDKWQKSWTASQSVPKDPFTLQPGRLFVAQGEKTAALSPVSGKTDNESLIAMIEADYPEIKTIAESERTRPETVYGYPWPANRWNYYEASIPSFRALRNSSQPLTLYALAKLETGDGAPALAATRAALRTERALVEARTLVSIMIACVQAKTLPVRLIHEGIARSAWTDAELRSLEAPLAAYDPVGAVRLGMIGEALASTSAINNAPRPEIFKMFFSLGEDFNPVGSLLACGLPRGWRELNSATLLDIARQGIAGDAAIPGRIDLTRRAAAEEQLSDSAWKPGSFIAASALPAFLKVKANSALTQTMLHCARLGIAIERHRLKTGALPESLAELSPGLIEKIPFGPVTGAAPVYSKNADGGYVLTFKGEDFSEANWTADPPVGKDVVWTMPAPKGR